MENKNNRVLVGIIVVLLLLVIGLSSFIIYDKVLNSSNNQNNNASEELDDNSNNLEEEDDNQSSEENVSSCVVGTYYGEASGTSSMNSMITYNYKYRYTFNEDGTYSADFNGVSGENGTYTLENGILTVSHLPEVGPGEMLTSPLELSSDCSYILYPIETQTFFKLYKQ